MLGAVFGIGMVIWFIGIILFILRRNKHPLRARSPSLLMVSALAGTFVLAYMYSRTFFDLVLMCPMSYYIIHACIPLYVLPYLFRCYRTIMLWRLNQAKAQLMNDDDSQGTSTDQDQVEMKESSSALDVTSAKPAATVDTPVANASGASGVGASGEPQAKNVEELDDKYFAMDGVSPGTPGIQLSAFQGENPSQKDLQKSNTFSGSVFSKLKNKTRKRFAGYGAGGTPWVVRNQYYFSERFLLLLLAIIFIAWVMLGM